MSRRLRFQTTRPEAIPRNKPKCSKACGVEGEAFNPLRLSDDGASGPVGDSGADQSRGHAAGKAQSRADGAVDPGFARFALRERLGDRQAQGNQQAAQAVIDDLDDELVAVIQLFEGAIWRWRWASESLVSVETVKYGLSRELN